MSQRADIVRIYDYAPCELYSSQRQEAGKESGDCRSQDSILWGIINGQIGGQASNTEPKGWVQGSRHGGLSD